MVIKNNIIIRMIYGIFSKNKYLSTNLINSSSLLNYQQKNLKQSYKKKENQGNLDGHRKR